MSNNFLMGSAEVAAGIALFFAAVFVVSIVFHIIMAIYLMLEEKRQFPKVKP